MKAPIMQTERSTLWKSTPRGNLIVISGPSGVGKDAILDMAFKRLSGITRSVSATTRLPRVGEMDGVDYYFVTKEEFETRIAHGLFLEYAYYGNNIYGTPAETVEKYRELGLDVILKIEVQGARKVRQAAMDAILIFIAPPSMTELERRLRARKTENEDRILERLNAACEEMSAVEEYDYIVTNDDLELAVQAVVSIVIAERHRIQR